MLALHEKAVMLQGEGELKVLHRILHPWADVQPSDTHIVFGGIGPLLEIYLHPHVLSLSCKEHIIFHNRASRLPVTAFIVL